MAVKYQLDDPRWATFYDVLGVDAAADFTAIKKAYYKRAKDCHPDRHDGDRDMERQFKVVVAAFDVLSDPEKRQGYDAHLIQQLASEEAKASGRDFVFESVESILDTPADDYLEELVVGNYVPPDANLQTLLQDLEQTTLFVLFREGKTDLFAGRVRRAHGIFTRCVQESPHNILYRFYLARACQRLRLYAAAEKQLGICVRIGRRRHPPLHLSGLRHKLYSLREKHRGVIGRIRNLMLPAPTSLTLDAEGDMVEEHARAMRKLLAPPKPEPRLLPGREHPPEQSGNDEK